MGEPASLIATVLSRRSEATAVASTSLYTQNSVLNADSSWDLQKENWLLLLKWVITVHTYTSHDISPCKRLKDENGADNSKSQSVAELWPANLRRVL